MTEDRRDLVVVNIISTSYAGSTWLNLVLGSHPQVFSVGEMDQLGRAGQAPCKLHGEECPVWSQYDAASAMNAYLQIGEMTGKRFLVVNNTNKHLATQQAAGITSRYIWLVRDGRAVVASSLRKYPDRGTWHTCRWFARSMRQTRKLYDRQDSAHRMWLNYEHATADTEAALKRICEFLGLDFDEQMLRFWEPEHHFVGGNPGPLLAVADAQDTGPLHRKPREGYSDDMSFYKDVDPARFRDERWQKELTDRQLRIFGWLAGRWNKRFGYPGSLERRGLVG